MTSSRYALYFAPPAGSALWRLASAWLGRDAATGATVERPDVHGVPQSEIPAITEEPARYGFHATLKPPFRLREGETETGLLTAVRAFAATQTAIPVPGLSVREIGAFVALTPSADTPHLADLAAACVETFDPWRAPLTARELEKRQNAGLTPREEALLQRWGYPYVMDAFRFHMTLTGPLDSGDRTRIRWALEACFEPVAARPFPVDAIAVFVQPASDVPFRILERLPFGDRT